MNTSNLSVRITDKSFLKQNDLARVLGGFMFRLGDYKIPFLVACLVLVVLTVGVPVHRYLLQRDIEQLAQAFYVAEQLPASTETEVSAKIKSLGDVVARFAKLPAVRLTQLKLASLLLQHKQPDAALDVLNAGIALSLPEPDVLSTVLVIKKVSVLKGQGKFTDAIKVLDQNVSRVISTYVDNIRLLKADLLVQSGKKDEAKALYQELSVVNLKNDGKAGLLESFDPTVSTQARDRVLLLELGQL